MEENEVQDNLRITMGNGLTFNWPVPEELRQQIKENQREDGLVFMPIMHTTQELRDQGVKIIDLAINGKLPSKVRMEEAGRNQEEPEGQM
jgi:hypothetical protein